MNDGQRTSYRALNIKNINSNIILFYPKNPPVMGEFCGD